MIVKEGGDDDNDDNLINVVQFFSSSFQATDLDFIWFNWLLLVDKESEKNFVKKNKKYIWYV